MDFFFQSVLEQRKGSVLSNRKKNELNNFLRFGLFKKSDCDDLREKLLMQLNKSLAKVNYESVCYGKERLDQNAYSYPKFSCLLLGLRNDSPLIKEYLNDKNFHRNRPLSFAGNVMQHGQRSTYKFEKNVKTPEIIFQDLRRVIKLSDQNDGKFDKGCGELDISQMRSLDFSSDKKWTTFLDDKNYEWKMYGVVTPSYFSCNTGHLEETLETLAKCRFVSNKGKSIASTSDRKKSYSYLDITPEEKTMTNVFPNNFLFNVYSRPLGGSNLVVSVLLPQGLVRKRSVQNKDLTDNPILGQDLYERDNNLSMEFYGNQTNHAVWGHQKVKAIELESASSEQGILARLRIGDKECCCKCKKDSTIENCAFCTMVHSFLTCSNGVLKVRGRDYKIHEFSKYMNNHQDIIPIITTHKHNLQSALNAKMPGDDQNPKWHQFLLEEEARWENHRNLVKLEDGKPKARVMKSGSGLYSNTSFLHQSFELKLLKSLGERQGKLDDFVNKFWQKLDSYFYVNDSIKDKYKTELPCFVVLNKEHQTKQRYAMVTTAGKIEDFTIEFPLDMTDDSESLKKEKFDFDKWEEYDGRQSSDKHGAGGSSVSNVEVGMRQFFSQLS